MNILFQFRNLLAHATSIEIKGEWFPDRGLKLEHVEHSKKSVFDYLKKEGFVNKPKFDEIIGWSFLKDEVADHFASIARTFLIELSSQAPDTDSDETIPKRIKFVLQNSGIDSINIDEPLYGK
jgi:hypothetical protein